MYKFEMKELVEGFSIIEKRIIFERMDIQSEKLALINWLISVNDKSVIDEIKTLRFQRENTISEDEIDEINEGKNDIKEGRSFAHEEVMENIQDRFQKLL